MERAEIDEIVEKLNELRKRGIEAKSRGERLGVDGFYDVLQKVREEDLGYIVERLDRGKTDEQIDKAGKGYLVYLQTHGHGKESRRKAEIIRIIYLLGGVFRDSR